MKMKKIVLCGSFSDARRILAEVKRLKDLGYDVFPTKQHLDKSRPCIDAHHKGGKETSETLQLRKTLMQTYFDEIRECDMIYVYNIKNGKEHIGKGVAIEIGFAIAFDKPVHFHTKPTDANIESYFRFPAILSISA